MTCAVVPGCRAPSVHAAFDHGCTFHTSDPTFVEKRLAGARRGGRVTADNSRLTSPKRALAYLAAFAAKLEADPSPDVRDAVQVARGVVEVALRLLDADGLQRRVRELEEQLEERKAYLAKCRKERRIP